MSNTRPNTAAILSQLKDFQRDTVDYVFQRLYRDPDPARRFLVADEVGLGKTLVARGLIAKTIDHLWRKTERIDVVYVCSNTDIARQNINRLNVSGSKDFCLASRITLLPLNLAGMQRRRVNFVSFTPGTSFDISQGSGQSLERELLYWLIANEHTVSEAKATRLLASWAGVEAFRDRVKSFPSRHPSPHPQIAMAFWKSLHANRDLLQQFDDLCAAMPRSDVKMPSELLRDCNNLIGALRRLLAESCLNWLEPDLIILDEFQRFKHLMEDAGEQENEAAQLAHHLFNYEQSNQDTSLAARVLLLSATPYKMYTQSHESEQDDHYADFERTLAFLLPQEAQRQQVSQAIHRYREALLRMHDRGLEDLLAAKTELERLLRRVMVRTERLATTADRNGMLAEVCSFSPKLLAADVNQYLSLQKVARNIGQFDVLDYWKSAPYLLNFMEDYDLKRKVRKLVDDSEQSAEFITAIRHAQPTLLAKDEIERYEKLDPANARLRALHQDTIGRGVWRLLWIPTALPYYQPQGVFADPELATFTKRLVFSCWRVVPKAISAVLSYEAEREMMQTFHSPLPANTAEERKRHAVLLRFSTHESRLTGMPVLGMIYPCRYLAECFDPLRLAKSSLIGDKLPQAADLLEIIKNDIAAVLSDDLAQAETKPGATDEAWYWAALLLLDQKHDRAGVQAWYSQPQLADIWNGGSTNKDDVSEGWLQHVERAREFLSGKIELGPPPKDLIEVLAQIALAGPGVVALRALDRVAPARDATSRIVSQNAAGALAHSFLHLFNLPEVTAMVRDRERERPYWKSVLDYCLNGNLQAVLDEYAHVLLEAEGLSDKPHEDVVQKISQVMSQGLKMRTASVKADVVSASSRRVRMNDAVRLRTRFAMRFGNDVDESDQPTRADNVRAAFNSPFWPFVLSTTSVGQEGLDFHPYCHAVVHWNLPSNPVDLEQREGRVHRYKGHALRKNIATAHGSQPLNGDSDIWSAMFRQARSQRTADQNDLYPFWITNSGAAKIERHVPALPHSRELVQKEQLRRSLVLYRMVYGQNRQEDLVKYLDQQFPEERMQAILEMCRISLAPIHNHQE